MNRLNLSARLLAAAAAGTVTLSLFGAVVSIAEPQQSVLMAKVRHLDATQRDIRMAQNAHADTAPKTAAKVVVAMGESSTLRK